MTVADAPVIEHVQPSSSERREFAAKLRAQTLACRVRHAKLGVRKALSPEQLRQAAEEFDADAKVLSAAKKIIDTKDPKYRAVANVRTRATEYWRSVTTPYPEPGVRLIRRGMVEEFNAKMTAFHAELCAAAGVLQTHYEELRDRARSQLGALFNVADYPARVDNEFDLEWDYPSIEPPAYLKDLHPQLYEEECDRIRGRFEEAVRLTEQAFVAKLQTLIAHLVERLRGDVDGKPKQFRDSSIENLNAFFEQFRSLDIGSSAEIQNLVDHAQNAIKGVSADDLRGNLDVRQRVADQLGQVQQIVDALMVNRPTRAISLEDEAA